MVAFGVEELAITAGKGVAFTVAIVRCGYGAFNGPPEEGEFLFRLTIGLRNIDGDWRLSRTSITPCHRQTSVARPPFSAIKPLPALAALSDVSFSVTVHFAPILLNKSKIEWLQNSRKCQFLVVSAARSLNNVFPGMG